MVADDEIEDADDEMLISHSYRGGEIP